ncbi:hypothetical protein [Succinimonas sp.]|uniref:hypothetical protein n=1 Tax=Succinimonas sp. TaxID=1936151 RepID=UPI0038632066
MGAIIKIQLSAFSNKKVLPSADNIAKIMLSLKEKFGIELLPSILNTQKIDVSTGMIKTVSNLSFSSMDNTEQIICSENRIDCIFNFSVEHQEETEGKFKAASDVLKFIMEKEKIIANRLALNVTFLSNICSKNSVFETQVMHVMPFYRNKTIKEWSSRTNAFGKMIINNVEEELNIITEYTYITESATKEARIICHADINTIAENNDFRFECLSVEFFERQAKEIFSEIQLDLEGLVTDGK